MHAARAPLTLALACALSACSGGTGESAAGVCADRVDNDGDGRVDCADPECAAFTWCAGGGDGGVDAGTSHDSGPRPDGGPRPDTGPIPGCSDPIDIVFSIDVSTSMTDEIDGIRRGIDSIWARAEALSTNVRFGLVVFVDDVVAVNGCSSFATVSAMQTELAMWQGFASSNLQPGDRSTSNTDCPENSIDALYVAATSCPWRPGALRILIHVTDDTFAERPAVLSADPFGTGGIPVQHTYGEAVSALMGAEVRVGAFAAPNPPEDCGAGSSPDVAQGFHAPYRGAPSIPEATGGRVWSIREVRAGTLDMAEAVNAFTMAEYCTLY